MNWKQNNRVAALTMGELAEIITQSVSQKLGYGRDLGFDGVPKDSYRAGLHWNESCVIRSEVAKYIPQKSLEQMGIKYNYVSLHTDSGTTVQVRLYLRKGHPLYHEHCKSYRQCFTIDLFTLHRGKARNSQGQILAFKELKPIANPGEKEQSILKKLTSYPKWLVEYTAERVNKAADRILASADLIGEEKMKQLIADFNTVRQLMDYSLSLSLLEEISLKRNRRLQSMVDAVCDGKRMAPVGLSAYCAEVAQGNVSETEKVKTNNNLVVFTFETGDSECAYWDVSVVVSSAEFDFNTLYDGLSSYVETPEAEDDDFEDIVQAVLDSCGWKWNFVSNMDVVPACDGVYHITV